MYVENIRIEAGSCVNGRIHSPVCPRARKAFRWFVRAIIPCHPVPSAHDPAWIRPVSLRNTSMYGTEWQGRTFFAQRKYTINPYVIPVHFKWNQLLLSHCWLRNPLFGGAPSRNLILKNDPGFSPLHLWNKVAWMGCRWNWEVIPTRVKNALCFLITVRVCKHVDDSSFT